MKKTLVLAVLVISSLYACVGMDIQPMLKNYAEQQAYQTWLMYKDNPKYEDISLKNLLVMRRSCKKNITQNFCSTVKIEDEIKKIVKKYHSYKNLIIIPASALVHAGFIPGITVGANRATRITGTIFNFTGEKVEAGRATIEVYAKLYDKSISKYVFQSLFLGIDPDEWFTICSEEHFNAQFVNDIFLKLYAIKPY